MPLYEYKCESCGKTFEIIQKFSDTPLEVHDECGGPVIRLVSPSALQFKGSGWYVTDYARSANGSGGSKDTNKKDSAGKDSAGSTDASAKSETKSTANTPASTSDKSDKKV